MQNEFSDSLLRETEGVVPLLHLSCRGLRDWAKRPRTADQDRDTLKVQQVHRKQQQCENMVAGRSGRLEVDGPQSTFSTLKIQLKKKRRNICHFLCFDNCFRPSTSFFLGKVCSRSSANWQREGAWTWEGGKARCRLLVILSNIRLIKVVAVRLLHFFPIWKIPITFHCWEFRSAVWMKIA